MNDDSNTDNPTVNFLTPEQEKTLARITGIYTHLGKEKERPPSYQEMEEHRKYLMELLYQKANNDISHENFQHQSKFKENVTISPVLINDSRPINHLPLNTEYMRNNNSNIGTTIEPEKPYTKNINSMIKHEDNLITSKQATPSYLSEPNFIRRNGEVSIWNYIIP